MCNSLLKIRDMLGFQNVMNLLVFGTYGWVTPPYNTMDAHFCRETHCVWAVGAGLNDAQKDSEIKEIKRTQNEGISLGWLGLVRNLLSNLFSSNRKLIFWWKKWHFHRNCSLYNKISELFSLLADNWKKVFRFSAKFWNSWRKAFSNQLPMHLPLWLLEQLQKDSSGRSSRTAQWRSCFEMPSFICVYNMKSDKLCCLNFHIAFFFFLPCHTHALVKCCLLKLLAL